MERNAFIERVRRAAESGRAYRVAPPPEMPARVAYVGAGDDPLTRFLAEVAAVGGHASLAETDAAALAQLTAICERYQVQSVLAWQHPVLERLKLVEHCHQRQIAYLDHARLAPLERSEQRQRILACDLGISSVDMAIGETGSLVLCARPGHERLASLAPPVHVAIVDEAQIVPDVFDLFDTLSSQAFDAWPSNVTLVTGPSKTGDLELRLTTGVHGPKHWHVIGVRSSRRER